MTGPAYTHSRNLDRLPRGRIFVTLTGHRVAVVPVVSVGGVVVDAWASGVAVLARSCGVASLQGFDAIRDPSCAGLHPSAELG